MAFLLPICLIPSRREGPSQVPKTLAPVPLPSHQRAHGIEPGSKGWGSRGRQWEGRGRSPERTGWWDGRRDDGGRNPSGAGRAARPGQAAAERARPVLQKTAASSPGRPHPAAGASGGSRTASRTGYPGQRPAAPEPPLAHRQTAPPVQALGAPQPRSPPPLRLRPLLAARSRAARPGGPASEWGRGNITKSGDGPPTGHRAAPRGLTDREDRRRWVWVGQSQALGEPG